MVTENWLEFVRKARRGAGASPGRDANAAAHRGRPARPRRQPLRAAARARAGD